MRTLAYFGNTWIGMFLKSNNEYTLVPVDLAEKTFSNLKEVLGTEIIRISIAETNLIGLYTAINSNGIILPNITNEKEIQVIKKLGMNVYVSQDRHNANGNNIVVNDKGGIINPYTDQNERKNIQDVLGVELIEKSIAQHTAVGSCCVCNNKGFLIHYKATEEEVKEISSILKVSGTRATVNTGVGFVSTGTVVNDKGYLVGEKTTPYEMGKIEESLGFL